MKDSRPTNDVVVPDDYDELTNLYGKTVQKKIRSMGVPPDEVDDLYQEVTAVLMRRDVLRKYHDTYCPYRSLEGEEALVCAYVRRHGHVTVEQVAEELSLPPRRSSQLLRALEKTGAVRTAKLGRDVLSVRRCWGMTEPEKELFEGGSTTYQGWEWHPRADNTVRFRRYLLIAAQNVVVDCMRRWSRSAQSLVIGEEFDDRIRPFGVLDVDRDLEMVLDEKLETLDASDLRIVRLKTGGHSNRQVSERLGIAEREVRISILRIRDQLDLC